MELEQTPLTLDSLRQLIKEYRVRLLFDAKGLDVTIRLLAGGRIIAVRHYKHRPLGDPDAEAVQVREIRASLLLDWLGRLGYAVDNGSAAVAALLDARTAPMRKAATDVSGRWGGL